MRISDWSSDVCSSDLACSPAAGWEKGQVENQVQTIRGRFFQPRLRFASIDEITGWLEAECRRWAERQAHPEKDRKSVVYGESVLVSVDRGGGRIYKKHN